MGSPGAVDARTSAAWLRRLARTTPGVIGIIALAVGAICVIAGLVCGAQLNGRINERNSVLTRSEPFAYAAQNLYAALSAADAAAASAFLSGGIETGPMRAQYQQALARASSALADATAGTTDIQTRTAMAEISQQLATYTALVEAARANNRQVYPIGSAYLREASSLMQTSLLPAAEKVYTANLATVEEDQRAIGSLPIVSLALLALALVAIGVGSVIMYRRTNRQFNIGLVVAAATVLLVIGWVVVATQLAASEIERSRTEGSERFEQLANARILAQQARTDETLELIARERHHRRRKVVQRPHRRAGQAARRGASGREGRGAEMDRQPPKAGRGLRGRRLRRRGGPSDRPDPALPQRSSPPSNPACATGSSERAKQCAIGCRRRGHGWHGVPPGPSC